MSPLSIPLCVALAVALGSSVTCTCVEAWAPSNDRKPFKYGALFSARAYAGPGPGPGYSGGYDRQDQYYYPPSREEEYYAHRQDYRDPQYNDQNNNNNNNQYSNQYDPSYYDYDDRSYNQPPPPATNTNTNDYNYYYDQQGYDPNPNNYMQDPYYYNQQQQQQQQQQQPPYDDDGYGYDPYQEAPPAEVYQETITSTSSVTTTRRDGRRLSRAGTLARLAHRPLLQGLLPSMTMMDVLQPAAAIFKTMVLQDELLDLEAVYDDAQRYLEQDVTCAELLGLPLRLDHPFSQSSATTSINGKTQSRTELQFPVDGQWNSGMVQLVATDDGILNMVLLVAQEGIKGYSRINVNLDNNINVSSPRDVDVAAENDNMANIVEAEILQHEEEDDDTRMLSPVEEQSRQGIPLLPGVPSRGPPSVQRRVPSMVDEATM
jgi:hypothetical protein